MVISTVLVALGFMVLLVTLLDVMITTLDVTQGAGPVTRRLADGLWHFALWQHRRRPSHKFLSFYILVILMMTLIVWTSLVLLGWTLVFSAHPATVVDTQTGEVANLSSRIYFVGYALITLGVGDFRPQGAPWQLATVLASANGFFIITFTITYLAPLVSAATQKRQLAEMILALGKTPQEVLLNGWNGKDFSALTPHLRALTPMVVLYGERHFSYPVLHYFHSGDRATAAVVAVAVLDEALTLLEHGVAPEARPDALTLRLLRQAIMGLLFKLEATFIHAADKVPLCPNLGQLRRQGIPTVPNEIYVAGLEEFKERRRLLLALVERDGWDWQEICEDVIQEESSSSRSSPSA